jgi:hypothetical protein
MRSKRSRARKQERLPLPTLDKPWLVTPLETGGCGCLLTAVRAGDGEERSTRDLLPQVKAGLVPVLGGVGEIVLDYRPDNRLRGGGVAVLNQPLGVADEGNSSQGRAVSLGSAPIAGVLCEVDIELGLPESSSVGQTSRGIRNTLDLGLCHDEVLDLALEGSVVVVGEGLYDASEDQSTVTGPGKVVWSSVSASPEGFPRQESLCLQGGSFLDGLATTTPGAAP